MALSNDNLITLEGNAAFRKIAAFEFTKAFQEIHRNVPVRNQTDHENESDLEWNQRVDNYMKQLSVEPKLENSIESDGKLNMWATKNLLSALVTYNIQVEEVIQQENETDSDFSQTEVQSLIDDVLGFEENGIKAIQIECTKILKGYSYRPQKIEVV